MSSFAHRQQQQDGIEITAAEPAPKLYGNWCDESACTNTECPPNHDDTEPHPSPAGALTPAAGPPVEGRLLSSTRSRLRWEKAFTHSRRIARRKKLIQMLLAIVVPYAVGLSGALLTGLIIYSLEGDDICALADEIYPENESVGGCYIVAVSVAGLITYRIGYGDILVRKTGTRVVCMLACSANILNAFIMTLRTLELFDVLLEPQKDFIVRRLGPGRTNHAYLLLYMLLVVAITGSNMLVLGFQQDSDGNSMSLTDMAWYMWATFSTVGYGDHTWLSIPNLNMGNLFVQYSFIVFGLVTFDGMLLRAFLVLRQHVSGLR